MHPTALSPPPSCCSRFRRNAVRITWPSVEEGGGNSSSFCIPEEASYNLSNCATMLLGAPTPSSCGGYQGEGSERGTRSHVPSAPPDFPTFIPAPPYTDTLYIIAARESKLVRLFRRINCQCSDPSYKSKHEMSQALLVEGPTD